MTPQEFTRRHEAEWIAFATMVQPGRQRQPRPDFPACYRRICAQLALARDRHYPPALVERLNLLALAGQQRLYEQQGGLWEDCLRFARGGFPALLRQHGTIFLAAAVIFYLPLLAMAVAVRLHPELIHTVLSPVQLHRFEEMYDPANHALRERGAGADLAMYGFYINNNIGIGFKTFASGILFGIGSLLLLLSNAIEMGAVAGHLTQIGYSRTFLSFVITHGAFELNAIVVCGMAGFMLGLALLRPGQQTRRDALVSRGRDAIRIVYGGAALFAVAAAFEGFWSANQSIPPEVKYGVGGVCWLLVLLYFALAGRRSHAA